MKITRVDNETVNCLITADDLDEQGIQLQDFFDRKQEAMEFLQGIMQRAIEEVDYHPTGAFLPMQITVLPDRSLSLTLSENSHEAFSELLKGLIEKAGLQFPKQFLEELDGVAEEDRTSKVSEYLQNLKEFTSSVREFVERLHSASSQAAAALPDNSAPAQTAPSLSFDTFVFRFHDMRSVIDLCKQVPESVDFGSSLYKNPREDAYYMYFYRIGMDPKHFASLFTMAYEFGSFVTTDIKVMSAMAEDMEQVMGEDVIGRLRQL